MIRTFTVIEPKKNRKKTWDSYYRTTRGDPEEATVWISELAITDQRAIFNHMGEYTTDNQDDLILPKSDKKWGKNLTKVQTFFNVIQDPYICVQKQYQIPLLLSFSNGFTEGNIADIMQWYRQMVHTASGDLPWNLPNFVETFTLGEWINNLPEFNVAWKKATIYNANNPNQVTHFVFKGYNIFIESQLLLILYDIELHDTPVLWQPFVENSSETKSDSPCYEIETIVQEGGKNRYERVLSNGARVECQSNGDIISYKPPPMSPKKDKTK
tara:strand:- start:240 stop:1049 length:810 start_codon:yes stop_codon:yes gene_type:complete